MNFFPKRLTPCLKKFRRVTPALFRQEATSRPASGPIIPIISLYFLAALYNILIFF